jgi:hypothetical protein
MNKIILLVLSALIVTSCATSNRNPASNEGKEDSAHEQYQGYFNKSEQ